MTLPKVSVLWLGGTIAMASTGGSRVVPTLTADDLISAVPRLAEASEVTASQEVNNLSALRSIHKYLPPSFRLLFSDAAGNEEGIRI